MRLHVPSRLKLNKRYRHCQMQFMRECMFAIGHFALGYLVGKGSSQQLKTKINLPLLLAASVLPDIDLILQIANPSVFMHRGPSHSIFTITILMLPFILLYRKQAIPYFAALLSHTLIGDLPTGGIEMLWPVSQRWFGAEYVKVGGLVDVVIELALFALVLVLLMAAKDLRTLFKPQKLIFILVVAFGAVLGPMLEIGQGSESALPVLLIVPSLFWLAVFSYSILVSLRARPKIVSDGGTLKATSQT
jgi:membrane-bound metal-dependent hydrolase YbcI (DUF457 family)